MADVVDHSLGDQELRRLRLGDLLDLPALREGELRPMAAAVARIERVEPVGVEVVDHVANVILAGERHSGDVGDVHGLGGEQHHLRSSPGHHRPCTPAHDPHQAFALVIIDLTHLDTLGHRAGLTKRTSNAKPAGPTSSIGRT